MTDNRLPIKILVIKLGALGDFIQAFGPMKAIRDYHPSAHIVLLTTKPFARFAKRSGYFDDIWVDTKPRWTNPSGWLSLRNQLNNADFKRVYDLQNNDRTRLYFRLFKKTNCPEWVGTARGASHRNTSPERTAGHAFDGHAQTLKQAGINNVYIDTLEWMDEDCSHFKIALPYTLIIPGSSPDHPQKRWPVENFSELAKSMANKGYTPVIIGGRQELELADLLEKSTPDAVNLVGQTSFSHLASLARNAVGAVGNDTGPMHLVAATGCPSIVLFSGHSTPEKHAPKGQSVRVLQESDLNDLSHHTVWETFLSILPP